ncbi:hypothetical protein MAR_025328 [Mya arenaria]|uniref:Uncharacterized protein n=1 Tax=Mya arenaria TaxID=6604 RepID=A0ABY7E1C0_MYAAR|nr:hypothetical protein MAR_025328 [Mya arenaria]
MESNQESDDVDEDDDTLAVLRLSRDLFSQDLSTLADIGSNGRTCDNTMTDWDRPAFDIPTEMKNSVETTSNKDDDDKDDECDRDVTQSLGM